MLTLEGQFKCCGGVAWLKVDLRGASSNFLCRNESATMLFAVTIAVVSFSSALVRGQTGSSLSSSRLANGWLEFIAVLIIYFSYTRTKVNIEWK